MRIMKFFEFRSNSTTGTNLPNLVGNCGCGGGRPAGCASGMFDNHHLCCREKKETKEGIAY